jgi:hypothetical protein
MADGTADICFENGNTEAITADVYSQTVKRSQALVKSLLSWLKQRLGELSVYCLGEAFKVVW